jgi:putative membrane protein
MPEILLTTVMKRPYVLGFLIAYAVIAWRWCGPLWTGLFLLCGYAIAFASEFSTINTGFPYGWYHYIYENLQGEWLNHGVPVWDSASYVFMSFAGLCAAAIALPLPPQSGLRQRLKLVALSAVFVTLLDIIIDPVAHQGERWFLGKIYFYPQPGFYFDVTLANFAGWLLTSFLINAAGEFVLGFSRRVRTRGTMTARNAFFALGLYYGICGFALIIAVALNEWLLVLCDLAWLAVTVLLLKGFQRSRA